MKRLHILIIILYGNAVSKSHALYFFITEPKGALRADQKPLIRISVRLCCKWF